VWGDPAVIQQGWDTSSLVGPQAIAAFLHNLPLMMDDTNQVPPHKANLIAEILYAIPNGHGRLRGTKDGGLREPPSWRTVLMTTGEQPITSYAGGNAGAKRRAICIRGAPMGKASEANSRIARQIKHTAHSHYGYAGALFVAHLCKTPREDLEARHAALTAEYEARGVGSTDRSLGAAVALIELASEIASESGAVPGIPNADRLSAVALAWSAAVRGGEDSDEPLAALRDLWSWCASNESRMWVKPGPHQPRPQAPYAGWAGSWWFDASDDLAEWSVVPRIAVEVLEKGGRRPDYCVSEWERRGLVVKKSARRFKATWFLVFSDEAMRLVVG
jgi:hypothetical protein